MNRMDIEINYVAVLVAAVVNMVLGAFWYGPAFGKKWMALSGMSADKIEKDKSGMKKLYLGAFLVSLLMAYTLAWFVGVADTMNAALMTGFWLWLGFIATVTASDVLWKGEPKELWMLDNGYRLLAMLAMSAVLFVM